MSPMGRAVASGYPMRCIASRTGGTFASFMRLSKRRNATDSALRVMPPQRIFFVTGGAFVSGSVDGARVASMIVVSFGFHRDVNRAGLGSTRRTTFFSRPPRAARRRYLSDHAVSLPFVPGGEQPGLAVA